MYSSVATDQLWRLLLFGVFAVRVGVVLVDESHWVGPCIRRWQLSDSGFLYRRRLVTLNEVVRTDYAGVLLGGRASVPPGALLGLTLSGGVSQLLDERFGSLSSKLPEMAAVHFVVAFAVLGRYQPPEVLLDSTLEVFAFHRSPARQV